MVYLLIGAFGEFWSNASELVCVLSDDDPVRAVQYRAYWQLAVLGTGKGIY